MGRNKSKKKPKTEFQKQVGIMRKLDNELAERERLRRERRSKKEKEKQNNPEV